jgi:hypothetical protein
MAYMQDRDAREKCPCGRPATKEVFSARDATHGLFCLSCATKQTAQLSDIEDKAAQWRMALPTRSASR